MATNQETTLAKLESLTEFLARTLVEENVPVTVEGRAEKDQLRLELHVPDAHRGQVIGKGGRIARAMRTLLNHSGIPNHQPVVLDIID